MIMNMTSSTSRTSTSGTTLIATKVPRFDPSTAIPMSHLARSFRPARRTLTSRNYLLAGFQLCGDQADLVDAGAAHDVDGPGYLQKHHIAIALYESDLVGAILENILQALAEAVPGGVLLVDFQLTTNPAIHQHLHDYGLVLEFLILLLVGIRLWNKRVEPLRRKRGDDHENDQQHQQNVDQRNDVHLRD